MHLGSAKDDNGITCHIAGTRQQVYHAKRLCHDVYLAAGYIKTAFPGGTIPYAADAAAVYIVALNAAREVVGTIRLTIGCPYHIFEAWSGKLYQAQTELMQAAITGRAFEIGALAVRKDCSYTGVSFALYKAAYDYSLNNKLDYAVIGMDQRALGSLIKYGWNFIQIGEPMEYHASLSVPAILPIRKQFSYRSPADLVAHNSRPLKP